MKISDFPYFSVWLLPCQVAFSVFLRFFSDPEVLVWRATYVEVRPPAQELPAVKNSWRQKFYGSYVRSSTGKGGAGARFRMPETSFQSKRVGYAEPKAGGVSPAQGQGSFDLCS
jgi:hypothetical protein